MSIATFLMILGGVAAFAYGIWAGLGQYRQSQEDIDRALSEPGRRRKATRHFTPLDLMARMTGVPTQRDRRNPFRFDEDESVQGRGSKPGATPAPRPPEGRVERGRRSAAEEGVDGDQDGSDHRSQKVSEPDDQA